MADITKKDDMLYVGDKMLKDVPVSEVKNNIVMVKGGLFDQFFGPGFILIQFMKDDESAQKMRKGQITYKMVHGGSWDQDEPPITKIWKQVPNDHEVEDQSKIIGVLQAYMDKRDILIDIMTVRDGYKRNSINLKMVAFLKERYPDKQIKFNNLTEDGEKFAAAFKKKRKELSSNETEEPPKKPKFKIIRY